MITVQQTIIFVRLLFYTGWCNFLRITRETDHESSGTFASCYRVSQMPSVHHLTVWYLDPVKLNGKKSWCFMDKIPSQTFSTEIISDVSRSCSESCISPRMSVCVLMLRATDCCFKAPYAHMQPFLIRALWVPLVDMFGRDCSAMAEHSCGSPPGLFWHP